jgi:hypothetical protein
MRYIKSINEHNDDFQLPGIIRVFEDGVIILKLINFGGVNYRVTLDRFQFSTKEEYSVIGAVLLIENMFKKYNNLIYDNNYEKLLKLIIRWDWYRYWFLDNEVELLQKIIKRQKANKFNL